MHFLSNNFYFAFLKSFYCKLDPEELCSFLIGSDSSKMCRLRSTASARAKLLDDDKGCCHQLNKRALVCATPCRTGEQWPAPADQRDLRGPQQGLATPAHQREGRRHPAEQGERDLSINVTIFGEITILMRKFTQGTSSVSLPLN